MANTLATTTFAPIETRYNGYRFRSRLEARWAVFFDVLGIGYEYETEGFVLLDGTRYLCDFLVPDWAAWVEIKPESADTDDAQDKLRELGEGSGRAGLLIAGHPWPGEYRISFVFPGASGWQHDYEFRGCFGCTSLWIANTTDGVRHLGGGTPYGAYFHSTCRLSREDGWALCATRGSRYGLTDRLDLAFRRARGARFEFGEHGVPA